MKPDNIKLISTMGFSHTEIEEQLNRWSNEGWEMSGSTERYIILRYYPPVDFPPVDYGSISMNMPAPSESFTETFQKVADNMVEKIMQARSERFADIENRLDLLEKGHKTNKVKELDYDREM